MLPLLFAATALAAPQPGFAGGLAVIGGQDVYGRGFTSVGPLLDANLTWGAGPFRYWLGLGGSALVAPTAGGEDGPASLLVAEAGAGIGGRDFSAGAYLQTGIPSSGVGLYARLALGQPEWGRVGVEGRLFSLNVADSGGMALMLRVEPHREKVEKPRRQPSPPPRRPPPPPSPSYPPPPPPPSEDPGAALPVDAAPPPAAPGAPEPAPPPPPPEDHHEDPYE